MTGNICYNGGVSNIVRKVSAGISSPVRKKLDLGPVDEYEVEYAPPRAQGIKSEETGEFYKYCED